MLTAARGPCRPTSNQFSRSSASDNGVAQRDFDSFGPRRGNHEVMMRGTFGKVRLRNLLAPGHLDYYRHGGISQYVLRQLLAS